MLKSIDVSANAFFPQFADRFRRFGYWKFLGPEWDKQSQKGWSVESLISSMDKAQVAMAALIAFWSSSPQNGEDCFITADELRPVIVEHPKRFFGLVGLNPLLSIQHKYFAPRYFEQAVKEMGFKGAHLALHWFGINPADKRLYPIYEKALELDAPIVMTLGAAPPRTSTQSVCEPVLLDPVIGDFPQLSIVGQHIGYPWERESVYLARNNSNFSIIADSPAPQFWPRDFVGFIKEGRFPKFDAGSDQVMWGSNFPMQRHAASRRQFEELGFNETIVTQILRDNAKRIFKLQISE